MEGLKKINIKKMVTNNFWLKLISLIIAIIIIWNFYGSKSLFQGIKI